MASCHIWKSHAKGLRKDNPPNGLSRRQANTQTRFHLTFWNGQIGCLENFRDHRGKEKKHGNKDKEQTWTSGQCQCPTTSSKIGESIKTKRARQSEGTTQGKDA